MKLSSWVPTCWDFSCWEFFSEGTFVCCLSVMFSVKCAVVVLWARRSTTSRFTVDLELFFRCSWGLETSVSGCKTNAAPTPLQCRRLSINASGLENEEKEESSIEWPDTQKKWEWEWEMMRMRVRVRLFWRYVPTNTQFIDNLSELREGDEVWFELSCGKCFELLFQLHVLFTLRSVCLLLETQCQRTRCTECDEFLQFVQILSRLARYWQESHDIREFRLVSCSDESLNLTKFVVRDQVLMSANENDRRVGSQFYHRTNPVVQLPRTEIYHIEENDVESFQFLEEEAMCCIVEWKALWMVRT